MTDRTSLATLYKTALESGAQAASLSALTEEQNAICQASLASFRALNGRVEALGLFSDNELFDEIATMDALYIVVPYAYADVLSRQRSTRRIQRIKAVTDAEAQVKLFQKRVQQYEILEEEERKLFKKGRFSIADASKRRETKIKQYKFESELKTQIKALRDRRDPANVDKSMDGELELLASLVPQPLSRYNNISYANREANEEDDDIVRQMTIMVIRLCWMKSHGFLSDLQSEKELLQKAPPEEGEEAEIAREKDERDRQREKQKQREKDQNTWRLDMLRAGGGPDGKGPLLDAKGRPLRPFTITSSSSANRARLQNEVFRPGHRLPTMTIEEYLQEEMARGNILTGGGPQSGEGLTSEELLQIQTEIDGALSADSAETQKRIKDEYWAIYKEDHRRGSGNTMNRG